MDDGTKTAMNDLDSMHFYSVKEWEENWDELFSRVENGETLGIINENGHKAVMIPDDVIDVDMIQMYTELNNEAP
jgi:predicted nuclease with TOPRIM domain